MKKLFVYLLLIFGVTFYWRIDVNAQDYNTKELIPVDSAATVSTDIFLYEDFVYNSAVDSKGNSVITFNSIKNISSDKEYVSINILLFDKDEKNIGFLTYCSKKDLDTDYSGVRLASLQASPFSINVTKRYFAGNNLAGDVKYIAVYDDNKYCQIGGYTKYAGLTISEISNGKVSSSTSSSSSNDMDFSFLNRFSDNGMFFLIVLIVLVIVFALFIINGMILNALYKRMYAKKTVLAYLPIGCNYVSVKLSFGQMVANIYLIGLLVSGVLSLVGISILLKAVNLLTIISFVIVIVKLITKKYDLFYYDSSIKNTNNLRNNINNTSVTNISNSAGSDNSFFNGQVDNSLVEEVNKDDVVDLSYSDASGGLLNSSIQESSNHDNLSSDSGTAISSGGLDFNSFNSTSNTNSSSNKNTTNKNGEESDLSKFFK